MHQSNHMPTCLDSHIYMYSSPIENVYVTYLTLILILTPIVTLNLTHRLLHIPRCHIGNGTAYKGPLKTGNPNPTVTRTRTLILTHPDSIRLGGILVTVPHIKAR